jgi:hypothetical protein
MRWMARSATCDPSRALPERERDHLLHHLREPRFADQTPTEVFAILLDEGTYLCSIRTMYRKRDKTTADQLLSPVAFLK